MIATLTLNPALDRTLVVEGFKTGEVNRVKNVCVDAGGKGVNVSRVIKLLGGDTAALGFLGGASGRELAALLDIEGIRHDFTWTEASTRINIKIVDDTGHTCTDLNESGARVSEDNFGALKRKVFEYASKCEMLVFSGSVPDGMLSSVYRDLILGLRDSNVKIMLDTSGILLKQGIEANPFLIKPNLSELSEITGCSFENLDDILYECKKLIKAGIKYVCVTLGADGLILVNGDAAVWAKPPCITARSTVGAGDTVCGSLALSLVRGDTFHEAARSACAAGAASVTLGRTGAPPVGLIKNIYLQTEVNDLR